MGEPLADPSALDDRLERAVERASAQAARMGLKKEDAEQYVQAKTRQLRERKERRDRKNEELAKRNDFRNENANRPGNLPSKDDLPPEPKPAPPDLVPQKILPPEAERGINLFSDAFKKATPSPALEANVDASLQRLLQFPTPVPSYPKDRTLPDIPPKPYTPPLVSEKPGRFQIKGDFTTGGLVIGYGTVLLSPDVNDTFTVTGISDPYETVNMGTGTKVYLEITTDNNCQVTAAEIKVGTAWPEWPEAHKLAGTSPDYVEKSYVLIAEMDTSNELFQRWPDADMLLGIWDKDGYAARYPLPWGGAASDP